MALNRSAKIALGVVGGVLVVGGVTYAVVNAQPAPKKKKKKTDTEPSEEEDSTTPKVPKRPRPGGGGQPDPGETPMFGGITTQQPAVLEEPKGGWEFRWDQAKAEAIPACREEIGSIDKLPWNGAWTELWRCIARKAFPETAGRLDYEDWPSWLRNEAASQIRQDVGQFLGDQGLSTQGWRFMLWLRFDGVIEGCYEALAPHQDAIAHCVASEIYPDEDWPPEESDKDWKIEFWLEVMDLVGKYTDLQEGRGAPFELEAAELPGPAA